MRLWLVVMMWAFGLLAAWRFLRGWRAPFDPVIVALAFGSAGAIGGLIGGDWVQALGQGLTLALVGTTALWVTRPRDRARKHHAILTAAQRRLIWTGFILQLAAIVGSIVVFILWVVEAGSVVGRILATAGVVFIVGTSVLLELGGRPPAFPEVDRPV